MRRTDGGSRRRLWHEHNAQTPEKKAFRGVCPRTSFAGSVPARPPHVQKSGSAKSKSGSATFHFVSAIFQNGTDTFFAHHFTAEPFLPRQVTELPLGKQTAAVDSTAAVEELGYATHGWSLAKEAAT